MAAPITRSGDSHARKRSPCFFRASVPPCFVPPRSSSLQPNVSPRPSRMRSAQAASSGLSRQKCSDIRANGRRRRRAAPYDLKGSGREVLNGDGGRTRTCGQRDTGPGASPCARRVGRPTTASARPRRMLRARPECAHLSRGLRMASAAHRGPAPSFRLTSADRVRGFRRRRVRAFGGRWRQPTRPSVDRRLPYLDEAEEKGSGRRNESRTGRRAEPSTPRARRLLRHPRPAIRRKPCGE